MQAWWSGGDCCGMLLGVALALGAGATGQARAASFTAHASATIIAPVSVPAALAAAPEGSGDDGALQSVVAAVSATPASADGLIYIVVGFN
ncbi:MAG: hypothetical protein OEM00_06990 [Burkholderiaceae bacterium]|nr:hypothetical protein [Burkholderiaceae bacterium]